MISFSLYKKKTLPFSIIHIIYQLQPQYELFGSDDPKRLAHFAEGAEEFDPRGDNFEDIGIFYTLMIYFAPLQLTIFAPYIGIWYTNCSMYMNPSTFICPTREPFFSHSDSRKPSLFVTSRHFRKSFSSLFGHFSRIQTGHHKWRKVTKHDTKDYKSD